MRIETDVITVEARMEVPQNTKIEFPYDLAISLMAENLRESKSAYHRHICLSIFIAALFTITKIWNQPRCPSQMSKENVVYIHNRILFSYKKLNRSFVRKWLELVSIILSKIN